MAGDRISPGRAVRRRPVPAAHSPGTACAPAGHAARGRPPAHGQGGGRGAGHQPQHRAQGLPRAGVPGPGRGATRGRHVRDRDAERRFPGRARAATPRPGPLAGQGPEGRTGRRKHRSSVPGHLSWCRLQGGRGGHSMTALEARGLGKQYGRRWALTDCTLEIPEGRVVGLVGPNGAGKSTLLNLAVGLLAPTTGHVAVLGGTPADGPAQLAKVGFVAQDTPLFSGLSVGDHLCFGAHTNPGWDAGFAARRVARIGLDPGQKAGKLSGGQRAQLALTLAIAKRPRLLILDEPVASLDPLARREFLQDLMEAVAEHEVSVILSSHLVSDLERVCDYLVVLAASRVQIAGDVDALIASHHRLIGPRRDPASLPTAQVHTRPSPTARQSTLIVQPRHPVLDPAWTVEQLNLEDLVLAYMSQAQDGRSATRPVLEVQR